MQHQDHTTRFTQLSSRRDLLRTAGAAGLALATGAAWAQGASGWPSKPVNLIVPFPAGGPTDTASRIVGQKLAERLKQRNVGDLQYYNAEVHGALFALPAYYRQLVG